MGVGTAGKAIERRFDCGAALIARDNAHRFSQLDQVNESRARHCGREQRLA
jgi:hypothetical protein